MNLYKGRTLYAGAAGAVVGLICMWTVLLTKVYEESQNNGQSTLLSTWAMWISLPMIWATEKISHLGLLGREDFASVLLLLSLYWMLIGFVVALIVYYIWHSLLRIREDRNRPRRTGGRSNLDV